MKVQGSESQPRPAQANAEPQTVINRSARTTHVPAIRPDTIGVTVSVPIPDTRKGKSGKVITSASLVSLAAAGGGLNGRLKTFDGAINQAARAANIPSNAAASLHQRLLGIRSALVNGRFKTIEEAQKLVGSFTALARQLSAYGLLKGNVQAEMDASARALLTALGDRFGMKLELQSMDGKVIGVLGVSIDGRTLTPQQVRFLSAARSALADLEQIKAIPATLNLQTLALLNIRDKLLQRSFELVLPPQPPLEGDYTEMQTIRNAIKTVDELLADTRKIPADLLGDLQKVTDAIVNAPTGEVNRTLDKIQNSVQDASTSAGDEVAKGTASAYQELNKAAQDAKDWGVKLSDAGKQLLSLVRSAPHDLSRQVGKVIDNYSLTMNLVHALLPPYLPFKYTLPVPIIRSDGNGNQIIIPAGSAVSKQGSDYYIEAPSLLIQSGDTIISSGAGTIKLGSSIDDLNFAQLSVTSGTTNVSMTGFEAQINRTSGASFIKADAAVVDLTNGQIKLTNGALTRDASGNLQLSADSFLYDKGGTQASLTGFNLSHTTAGGVSTLSASAGALDLQQNGTTIKAQNFSIQMVRGGDPAHPDTARLTAENVDLTSASDRIQAAKATIDIVTNSDGSSSIVIKGDNPSWQSADKSLQIVGAATLTLDQAPDGTVRKLQAQADQLTYTDPKGVLKATGGSLIINYGATGQVSGLSASASSLNYTGPDGNLLVNDGKLDLVYGSNGLLQSASASAQHVEWSGKWGQFVSDGQTTLNLTYSDGGKLASLQADAAHLAATTKDGTLDLTGGKLNLNYGPDGKLQSAVASATQGSYTGSFGTLGLSGGGSLSLNYGPNGTLTGIQGQVGAFTYTGDKGQLLLTGGKVDAAFGPDGKLTSFKLHGDGAIFTGTTVNDKSTKVFIQNFNGQLVTAADGSQTLTFDSKNGSVEFDGRKVSFDQIKQLEIHTNADGAITSIDLNMPDKTKYTQENGDLEVLVKNLQGHYRQEGNRISLSFDSLDAALKSTGISVHAEGGTASLDDKQLRVHVDSAKFLKEIGEQLQLDVVGVDLLVEKTAEGAIKSADLQLAGLTGKVKGYDILVTTSGGERVRLHVETGPDGTVLQSAYLQIPNGGEIQISNEDLTVKLGPQMIRFTQDGKGIYTLRDEGINIAAETKGVKVQVTGGTAEIMLDANTGNLIIREITGTKVHLDIHNRAVDIDLTKLENLLVRMTDISGLSKGAMIQLVPTGDHSELTARISTNYKGVPITITFDNLAGLDAMFTYRQNELHAYAADPGHRGNIQIQAGPIKLEGTAIDVVARYNPYNAHRLMETMGRFLTVNGIPISEGKGVTMERDGVLRFSTTRPGVFAELAVVFPNNTRMSPGNRWNGAGTAVEVGPSVIGSLGATIGVGKHTTLTGAVFAGAVSGSYLTWDQARGSASVYGVPLPNTMDIPATAVAGIRTGVQVGNKRLDTVVGGFANPVGFVKQGKNIGLVEDSDYGIMAGVHYTQDNVTVSVDGVIGHRPNKPPDPGIRVSTEVLF